MFHELFRWCATQNMLQCPLANFLPNLSKKVKAQVRTPLTCAFRDHNYQIYPFKKEWKRLVCKSDTNMPSKNRDWLAVKEVKKKRRTNTLCKVSLSSSDFTGIIRTPKQISKNCQFFIWLPSEAKYIHRKISNSYIQLCGLVEDAKHHHNQ